MKVKLKSFTVYFKDLRIFNRIFGKWLIMAGEVNEMTYRRLLRVKTHYKVIVHQAALHKTPSFHLISSRGNFVETDFPQNRPKLWGNWCVSTKFQDEEISCNFGAWRIDALKTVLLYQIKNRLLLGNHKSPSQNDILFINELNLALTFFSLAQWMKL